MTAREILYALSSRLVCNIVHKVALEQACSNTNLNIDIFSYFSRSN